jgi:transcriptional regulator with GAF, ATPase, and Fis domain
LAKLADDCEKIRGMSVIPSRESLAALTGVTNEIVPVVSLGFSRSLDDTRVSILYSNSYGIGEFVLSRSDVPEAMLPSSDGARQCGIAEVNGDPQNAVDWFLNSGGVQRVLSIPVSKSEASTRFWIGCSDPRPLTGDQLVRVEAIVASNDGLLGTSAPPVESVAQLRRLELAAGLLPALLHVLDIREVFDRLSTTAKQALPHDLLLLILFNEDLSQFEVYARSDRGSDLGSVLPSAYPAAAIRAWEFLIVDDHVSHPQEHDTPTTKMGARSSLRFPIRFDNRVIGDVGFISYEPRKYTSADVAVGRRLADHVSSGLSHYNIAKELAEQARRNEELRAKAEKSDLLDEVLASVTSTGGLREVFERISDVTQKVLAHDTLLVAVRLSDDDRHGKIYAIKAPAPFPELVEIPPYIRANPDWDFEVVDDLKADPSQRQLAASQSGYRSALRVPIRIDNEFVAGLSFLAFAPAQYSTADVPAARRIANRVALSLARERGATLLKRVDEATERASRLEARVRALTEELDSRTGYRRVVGESAEWHHVLKQATQVASTDATVLLLGDSGTGKEVVARFVHRASSRNGGPFVALNCAALPEQLLESELFGYERGAFTGAMQSKPGQLEQASGGTLFLDEVGEMSLSAQAKFLRVLQEREFQRLGGTRVLRSDARIVAATNRDLHRAITQGQFREDLYYRLNVFAIRLPALRDRREDILPLSEAFLSEIGSGIGRPPGGISRDAKQMLTEYHWPGNVRELRNILERAAILCDGGLITAEHLALRVSPPPATPPPEDPATAAAADRPSSAADLQSMEREMIEQALQNARFNKSKAAKALGLTRHQLYVRMRKYGFQ